MVRRGYGETVVSSWLSNLIGDRKSVSVKAFICNKDEKRHEKLALYRVLEISEFMQHSLHDDFVYDSLLRRCPGFTDRNYHDI